MQKVTSPRATRQTERLPQVVVADDHPIVLAAFGRMLRPWCEVIASVPNGQQAIDATSRLRPDVLVVDLMMPDVDGLEVCRIVRRIVPETRVIIVTAYDDSEVQALAMQVGAAAFVPKHSAATTLRHTIRRVCAERSLTQPAE
jgi:DNA-binding NarL/FixJ family response regulator